MITRTGEKDHVVNEDDSVVSDDMSDMGEECDLRTATIRDVSLSEGVVVPLNPSQEGRRNSPAPCRCVCVRETRLALCHVNVFSFTSYVFPPRFYRVFRSMS